MTSKAERLAIASAIAPVVRRDADRLLSKRIKVYSQATGETVRIVSGLEAQLGIQRTAGIEFDVRPDVRPEKRACASCGRLFRVASLGTIPDECAFCRFGRCANCETLLPRSAIATRSKENRGDKDALCKPCYLEARRATTHCPKGHEYTPENTKLRANGRACRACERERERARHAARRAERLAEKESDSQ